MSQAAPRINPSQVNQTQSPIHKPNVQQQGDLVLPTDIRQDLTASGIKGNLTSATEAETLQASRSLRATSVAAGKPGLSKAQNALKDIATRWKKDISYKLFGFRSDPLKTLDRHVASYLKTGDAAALLKAVDTFSAQKPNERKAAVLLLRLALLKVLTNQTVQEAPAAKVEAVSEPAPQVNQAELAHAKVMKETQTFVDSLKTAPHRELTSRINREWQQLAVKLEGIDDFALRSETVLSWRHEAEEGIQHWHTSVQRFNAAKVDTQKSVHDAQEQLHDVLENLKAVEHRFREQFSKCHVVLGTQLTFIKESLMRDLEKDLVKQLGKTVKQEDIARFVEHVKDIALERQFGAVVRAQNQTLFQNADSPDWNGGLRLDKELDLLMQHEIQDFASATKLSVDDLTKLVAKKIQKPIEGLLVFSSNQHGEFTVLDVAKNAYASVPKFYSDMMEAVTTETQTMQKDVSDFTGHQLDMMTSQMDVLSHTAKQISVYAGEHLQGSEQDQHWSLDRLKPIVVAAFKKEGLEVPSDADVQKLAQLVLFRLNEKRFLTGAGLVKSEIPNSLDLISKDKNKPSFSFVKSAFADADSQKMLDRIAKPLSAMVIQAVAYSQQGGQAAEMTRVESTTSRYTSSKMTELTANFRLKMAYMSSSLDRAKEAYESLTGSAKENLGLGGTDTEDPATTQRTQVFDTVLQSSSTVQTLTKKAEDLGKKVETLTQKAVDGLTTFVMSTPVKEVVDLAQTAVSMVPYAGELQAGILLMTSVAQYIKAGYSMDKMRARLSDIREAGTYFTQKDMQDPVKKGKLQTQLVSTMKLLESSDAQEKALGKMLIHALNVAIPFIKLGTFVQEAHDVLVGLGINDKEELYKKAAESALTIAADFEKLGTGSSIDRVRDFVLSSQGHETVYDISAAAQKAAFLMPDQSHIQQGLRGALSSVVGED